MPTDPNEDRNDPMVPEYWSLGEDLQDAIRISGYDHPFVEGIAVDIHDLLQASDSIRVSLASDTSLSAKLESLKFELEHMLWHCESALSYLEKAAS